MTTDTTRARALQHEAYAVVAAQAVPNGELADLIMRLGETIGELALDVDILRDELIELNDGPHAPECDGYCGAIGGCAAEEINRQYR